jgi:hypothetical protein
MEMAAKKVELTNKVETKKADPRREPKITSLFCIL